MFKNYLKTAWRNLLRNKAFSFINILGLGLGIACSLFIYLWVQDELSYDGFHAAGDRLYRVIVHTRDKDGSITNSFDATPGRLAETLVKEIPEVSHACIVLWDNKMLFETNGKIAKESGRYVGPDFFKMFSFPLIQGNAQTVLTNPSEIVITRKLAENYFGHENPIGKTIRIDNKRLFTVSGVAENVPQNSSIKFDFVLPVKYCFDDFPWLVAGWGFFGPPTYVMLNPGASPAVVNEKIKGFLTRHDEKVTDKQLSLQPYEEMYLHARFTNGIADGGRIEYVRLFTIIAIFILVIACINFMNLTTARSAKRAKEIGVRKVIGARRIWLFAQFIGEAVLTTLFAVVIAIGLALIFNPMFNTLTGKDLPLPFLKGSFLLAMLAFTLVVGFIAGSYPALYMSSINPIKVLKGRLKFRLSDVLVRKGLVVFQFVLSTFLIICTALIFRQMQFIQTKNLGIDRSNTIYLPLTDQLSKNPEPFLREIVQSGGTEGVTKVSSIPTDVGMHTESVNWPGKDPSATIGFWDMSVDYNFLKTMKVELKEGRDYDPGLRSDSANFLVNEEAVRIMNVKNVLGMEVTYNGRPGKIIGIVKNFHFQSLHDPIAPLFISFMQPQTFKIGVVRTQAGKTKTVLAAAERAWKQFNPKYPFDFSFADELFKQQYLNEKMVEQIAKVAAFLAIFISCMGLFGLAIFVSEQRIKEISIRKTLGATSAGVVAMLSKDFIKLVLIAVIIAFPAAWWAMSVWLQQFSYRVAIGWQVFIFAAITTTLVAMLTVSFQAAKAAIANPAKNLRTE